MKKIHASIFQPGLIVNQEFFDYPDMQKSAKNWLYLSKYRFDTGEFYGRHDGIQLNNLQFGHAVRHEGMFLEGVSPAECLSIVIRQKSGFKICINHFIMEVGDVIIIDDLKAYDFSSSHHSILAIISIDKSFLLKNVPELLLETNRKYKDKDNILSDIIEDEWKNVLDSPLLYQSTDKLQEVEAKIVDAMKRAFKGQIGELPHLKKGEVTALEIKSFLLKSLDENISIERLAQQFGISNKTLENSFNSLFGITPKRFLVLLKLNHAHEDLSRLDLEQTSVSEIAMKWGFTHFGRFSKNYKELFGVLPSETLTKSVELTY